jgi:hypothetical protein
LKNINGGRYLCDKKEQEKKGLPHAGSANVHLIPFD